MTRPTLLSLTLALVLGCGSPPASRPPASSAQRYNGEGLRRLERGDLKGADEMLHDALREAELVDDLQGQAEAWNNLGALASARGDAREAWACHAAALRLYKLRGARDPGLIRTHTNLGGTLLLLGSTGEAEQHFRAAAELAEQLDAAPSAAMARIGLAAAELHRGNARAAADLARREVDGARSRKDEGAQAAALSIEGTAMEALLQLDDARKLHEEALSLDRKREHPRAVRDDLRALARLSERQPDRAAASSYLARAARVSRRMGELDAARSDLKKAIELLGGQGEESRILQSELDALQEKSPR